LVSPCLSWSHLLPLGPRWSGLETFKTPAKHTGLYSTSIKTPILLRDFQYFSLKPQNCYLKVLSRPSNPSTVHGLSVFFLKTPALLSEIHKDPRARPSKDTKPSDSHFPVGLSPPTSDIYIYIYIYIMYILCIYGHVYLVPVVGIWCRRPPRKGFVFGMAVYLQDVCSHAGCLYTRRMPVYL